MILRARIEYPDDVADSVEDWPSVYSDLDAANRLTDVMLARNPGASCTLAQVCPKHGEEDVTTCCDCSLPVCAEEARRTLDDWCAVLCEDCCDDRRERAEETCGICNGSGCCSCHGVRADGAYGAY